MTTIYQVLIIFMAVAIIWLSYTVFEQRRWLSVQREMIRADERVIKASDNMIASYRKLDNLHEQWQFTATQMIEQMKAIIGIQEDLLAIKHHDTEVEPTMPKAGEY